MSLSSPIVVTPVELYAFGSRASPRAPRPGIDLVPNAAGMVGPEVPPFPQGASTFADPLQAPLRGHYHRLPPGTVLPGGLAVVADGVDVHVHSLHPATHHTVYAAAPMAMAQFLDLLLALPWQYVGKKP